MDQLTTKNAEDAFLSLQKSANEIAEKCSKLTITDDTSLLLVTQQYSLLKGTIADIEKIRVKEKAPYLDAGKQIDALAKKLSTPLETVLAEGGKKLLAYNKMKAEIAQKEQNRINTIKSAISKYSAAGVVAISGCKTIEELAKVRQKGILDFVPPAEWSEFDAEWQAVKVALNDLCIARRIEITAPAQADETLTESIKDAIVDKVEEVGVEEVAKAEFTTTSKIKGTWRFELVDKSQLIQPWIAVDEKAVKSWIAKNKDNIGNGEIVDGIKFFIEESVTIR
jgi:hypothetical protein